MKERHTKDSTETEQNKIKTKTTSTQKWKSPVPMQLPEKLHPSIGIEIELLF